MVIRNNLVSLIVVLTLIGFVGCGGGSSGSGDETPKDLPPVSDPETSTKLINPPRENNTAVGFSTFGYATDGKFPIEDSQSPEGLGFNTVAKSVRHIATNEWWLWADQRGDRPLNRNQVKKSLANFIAAGHQVTHLIYVFNGPGLRSGDGEDILGELWYGNHSISDEEQIDLLFSSSEFRELSLQVFKDVVAYARELEALGVEVLINPEVEDNHDDSEDLFGSYGILMQLLNQAGWTDITKTVRNGGRPRNTPGLRYEKHPHNIQEFNAALAALQAGDVINTDGNSFEYASEDKSTKLIPERHIREMIAKCEAKGVIFFVWYAELDGYRWTGRGDDCSHSECHNKYPNHRDREYNLYRPKEAIAMFQLIDPSQVMIQDLATQELVVPAN